ATPLSKFEVTMDEGSYREVIDPAVTVAFRLKNDDVYLLAWTTTPWTLPANTALAIDPKAEYVKVSDGERFYILAHQALERYQDGSLEVVEYIPGKKLLGEAYEPLFDYVSDSVGQDFTIYAGDFVSMDEGTGIVHIAPGFGEDDTALGEKNGLTTVITLDDEGHFLPIVKDWAGKFYRAANEPIIENLRQRHHLFRQKKISHSYPHCYRCDTPLIYKSQVSWYMKIDQLRKDLKAKNKEINWVPQHFGTGRFKHNLESAPDWSLSRTRYWGTPIPVWETKDGELFVPESVAELEKLSGQKIDDLHRPAIDQVELKLPNGQKAKRVKEVLDVWFESGSMPYAQDHYPFSGKKEFAQHHPADF
ncbi:MAG: class I tRNA ligase family protein, partial [Patescibacteria group bacterium]